VFEGFTPDPELRNLPVALGGDLEPETLLSAYRNGVFPWPEGDGGAPLAWWSPDPRPVIPVDGLHVSKTLRRRVRSCGWETSVDARFGEVVTRCAARPEGTWISPEIRAAYVALHELGHAHSLEVWEGDALVGGLYGVLVGAVFCGESMFHVRTDASKVALLDLVVRLGEAGGLLVDVQVPTEHFLRLGALLVSRESFLDVLRRLRDVRVELARERLPVARLA
jgi:leucyl/phenylalanyl-tRNA--protein transferase